MPVHIKIEASVDAILLPKTGGQVPYRVSNSFQLSPVPEGVADVIFNFPEHHVRVAGYLGWVFVALGKDEEMHQTAALSDWTARHLGWELTWLRTEVSKPMHEDTELAKYVEERTGERVRSALYPFLDHLRDVSPYEYTQLKDGATGEYWIEAFLAPLRFGWRNGRYPPEVAQQLLKILDDLEGLQAATENMEE